MSETTTKFDQWAILELMGHRRLAGKVTETIIAGMGALKIDVPNPDGSVNFSQIYNPSSMYCLTPCTQEVAVKTAQNCRPEPVTPLEFSRRLPKPDSDEDPDDSWNNDSFFDDDDCPDETTTEDDA